jgi:hypothetical protein
MTKKKPILTKHGHPWAVPASLALALATTMAPDLSMAAEGDPSQVSFTLSGCKNNGSITLPNGDGKYICADSAYTTGNLGKGWNELDLVPYRVEARAGNSAPSSQTYTVSLLLDNKDAGYPGYDVLATLTLNTALSSPACAAPVVTDQLITTGYGGVDQSIYRKATITQAKNTTCVYDTYGRLAIGSHLFSGSSLHANLANQALTAAGIGSKEVSIPVNEISPQALRKDMNAKQNTDQAWNLSKQQSPASISFGDVCETDAPQPQKVTFRVEWQKIAATPGMVNVTTNIYAKNPAARTIAVNVNDKIFKGMTQTTLLNAVDSGEVDVPANTEQLVLTHTVALTAEQAGNIGDYLNDVATATYIDKATAVAVPGQTTAQASAQIEQGAVSNSTAQITDTESMTGTGLTFSVAQPAFGSFANGYLVDTQTVGPVVWNSGIQTGDQQVEFVKTFQLDAQRVTSGLLTDTAMLVGSDGFTTQSTPIIVSVDSSASVKLALSKEIPPILTGGEKLDVNFLITRAHDPSYQRVEIITFAGGDPLVKSVQLSGLVPDDYTVLETGSLYYPDPATCGDACNPTANTGLQAQGSDTRTVSLSLGPEGKVTQCAGTASFINIQAPEVKAKAQVKKLTAPVLLETDPDYNWTFTLNGPGIVGGVNTIAPANGGGVLFPVELEEGVYTVTETLRPNWDLDGAVPNDEVNTKVCSFAVNYPLDNGKTFECTFSNTQRGQAKVEKTVSGLPIDPAFTNTFTFQLREGASLTANGTILDTQTANAGNLGSVQFTPWLIPGTQYQLCEMVMPGWKTSLTPVFVPNSLNNPEADTSIKCFNFTVAAGETKSIAVDNTPPTGGDARTIGFWRNWASCKKSNGKQDPVLDRTMAKATLPGLQVGSLFLLGNPGNPDVAPDCAKAVSLISKSSFDGKKMASDPLFGMTAQLVAAEANLAAGAYYCDAVKYAVIKANTLLSKYGFTGIGYTGKLSTADSKMARDLAGLLDNYNNNDPGVCN